MQWLASPRRVVVETIATNRMTMVVDTITSSIRTTTLSIESPVEPTGILTGRCVVASSPTVLVVLVEEQLSVDGDHLWMIPSPWSSPDGR